MPTAAIAATKSCPEVFSRVGLWGLGLIVQKVEPETNENATNPHPRNRLYRFFQILDTPYQLAIDAPVGSLSNKFLGVRLRTGELTRGALYFAAMSLFFGFLDEQEQKKIEFSAEENAELLDQMILEDFRLVPLRIALQKNVITPEEARKRARLIQYQYYHYYEYIDKQYQRQSLEASDSVVLPWVQAMGVIPEGVMWEKLSKEQMRRIIDLNHLYFSEIRVLGEISGVSADGKLLVSSLRGPQVDQVLESIQSQEQTITHGLVKLYLQGHKGKTITLPTLKRFLIQDAWIRAIEHGEIAMDRDPAPIGKTLRRELVMELRTWQVSQTP